jgi:ubiquitin carboxyl-terminal hydrolase 22/27/51
MLPYVVKKDKDRIDTSKYIYDLSTVIVHQGTMDSGHYFAYTRLGGEKVRIMTLSFQLRCANLLLSGS